MRRGAALLVIAAAAAPAAHAQRVALEGVAAAELWQTDAGSRLLARNEGRLAPHALVYGWLSLRPTARLELLVLGEAQAGAADADDGVAAEVELLEARYAVSDALQLAGGRILMPLGLFGARRFPHTNPVIGYPDLYPPLYPWGGMASGSVARFDWRAALVSLPAVNPRYTPEPGHRMRPLIGAGVSLGPALHVGLAWTHGPYLGPVVDSLLPAGTRWEDFAQTVVSADARFSAGYVETRAEAAWSTYEVPTVSGNVDGFGWYVESRVTLSPRTFVALRLERFDYAFVRPRSPTWTGRPRLEQNAELGVGYRFSPQMLLKLSARRDNWPGPDSPPNFLAPNGYAFATQFSWQFSAAPLLQPRY